MLFMPGNNPGMLQNAGIFGADSIILDLEDAVSLTEKDSARILVREAIKNVDYNNVEVVVRINPFTTEFAQQDIDVIARVKPDASDDTKGYRRRTCSYRMKYLQK